MVQSHEPLQVVDSFQQVEELRQLGAMSWLQDSQIHTWAFENRFALML